MTHSELGDEDVHVSLLTVGGRVKAARFIMSSGSKELLEFTEEEQLGSEDGKPSEVQREKIEAVISRLKTGDA